MTTSFPSAAIGTTEARSDFLSRPPGLCALAGGRALVLALTVCPAVGSFAGRGKGKNPLLPVKAGTWPPDTTFRQGHL